MPQARFKYYDGDPLPYPDLAYDDQLDIWLDSENQRKWDAYWAAHDAHNTETY